MCAEAPALWVRKVTSRYRNVVASYPSKFDRTEKYFLYTQRTEKVFHVDPARC